MRNVVTTISKPYRSLQRLYSSQSSIVFQPVDTLRGSIDSNSLLDFRQRAFIPEKPILITTKLDAKTSLPNTPSSGCSVPASVKWFEAVDPGSAEPGLASQAPVLSHRYLSTFGDTILPYEYVVDDNNTTESQESARGSQDLSGLLEELVQGSPDGTFHRFNAPLSLFLQACRWKSTQRLYIAQAQIADLPKQLQDDLPTPRLVKEAGKGDIYDANIWMGIPPTYTPLHKDPNPNLFVQLSNIKRVRLFRPSVGASIYREVQQRIGQSSPSTFRGEEMMQGPERDALDESVWGQSVEKEGYEVVVNPGDALFIPKGWWHSIKGGGNGVTVSVNWWFR